MKIFSARHKIDQLLRNKAGNLWWYLLIATLACSLFFVGMWALWGIIESWSN